MRFRFVAAESQFPVSLLCKAVGVSRGGFYAWKRRAPSKRRLEDAQLLEQIRQIHTDTSGIYGARQGCTWSCVSATESLWAKRRVARLIRAAGLRGADGRRGGPRTTTRNQQHSAAADLVDRQFCRPYPNQLWVCDIKYVQTGQGFLFLAAVQDVYSRRIVGWSMRDDLQTELVLDALGTAVTSRGAQCAGVVAHSDHGSQSPVCATAATPSSPRSP